MKLLNVTSGIDLIVKKVKTLIVDLQKGDRETKIICRGLMRLLDDIDDIVNGIFRKDVIPGIKTKRNGSYILGRLKTDENYDALPGAMLSDLGEVSVPISCRSGC